MIPIAWAGVRFETNLGVSASFVIPGANGPATQTVEIDRANDVPILVGTRQSTRTLTVAFTVIPPGQPNGISQDFEITRAGLLAALDPRNSKTRTLTVQFSQSITTEYDCECRVGQYRFPSPVSVEVDFYAASDVWTERADTTTIAVSASNTLVIPLENRGGATADMTGKFAWSVNKASGASLYKKSITITNTGTRHWKNVRFTILFGDHGALVTGAKSLANGNDVLVYRGRRKIPRTISNPNTGYTLIHIRDTIKAGGSATYDVWYGNLSASSPRTLSSHTTTTDDYAADDLQADSGTATAGAATTLTDAGKSWEVNQWAGGYIYVISGGASAHRRRIVSNTATVITIDRKWENNASNTSVYVLWRSGISVNGGAATSAGTTTTLTDSFALFNTNEWKGGSLYNQTKGIGPFPIVSNTGTVITISGTMTAPASTDRYYVIRAGLFNWMVDKSVITTSHRGLWKTSHYFNKGGRVRYGDAISGGWVPWLMLDNQDDFATGRFVDEGSGGGHAVNIWPYQYTRRGVRSENTWPEKKLADGIAIYDPRGIQGFEWNYRFKNEGTIGIIEVRTQAKDGDSWQTVASDATVHTFLQTVTSGGATGYTDMSLDETLPVRIWTGLLPSNDTDGSIPSTVRKDYSAELRDATIRRAWLDLTDCGGLVGSVWTVGAETGIYDYKPTARFGGGPSSEPPYTKLQFGPGLGLESGQQIWVNGDPGGGRSLFEIRDSTDVFVRRAPWAATLREYQADLDGNAVDRIPSQLLVLPPGNLMAASADAATGWTKTDGTGVTSALSTVTSTKLPGHTQSIQVLPSVLPAGAWVITLRSAWFAITPDTLYEWGLWTQKAASLSSILVEMLVQFADVANTTGTIYDPDSTVSVTAAANGPWYTAGGGRHVYAGPADDGTVATYGATTQARVTITATGSGSALGAWRLGAVIFGGRNLYLTETGMGTLTFKESHREAIFA